MHIPRPARCAALSAPVLALFIALGCTDDSTGDGAGGSSQTVGGGSGDAGPNGGGTGGMSGSGGMDTDGVAALPRWDWTGVIGTGQSLSVGEQAAIPTTTTQAYQNLKLSLGSAVVPPFDADAEGLSMVPLVEPIRANRAPCTYPCAYPQNIYGETPHTAMANQISALVQAASQQDYVTAHTVVGENGQGMIRLQKDAMPDPMYMTPLSTARAYEATLFEARAIARLAAAEGKTYGMGAIIVTHGESDEGRGAQYEADLVQLWSDYNADIKTITGQTESFPMLVSQQHSVPSAGVSTSAQVQWNIGKANAPNIICSGPKYQYPYAADAVHMTGPGYIMLGEKYGEVFFERVVLGNDWRPLEPTRAVRAGARAVSVEFHVPVTPLVWDETLPAPHQGTPEWANGRGFELSSGATRVGIESVEIAGDAVTLNTSADLPAGALTVGYAATANAMKRDQGTVRWGQLRDSDALVGAVSQQPQPNFAVAFQMPVE